MNKYSNIFVAGHKGLVGSSIVRSLESKGFKNIITKSKNELDLTNQKLVDDFFSSYGIDYVFDAAAKVGGIHANDIYSGEFIYQNMMIQTNLIHSSWKHNVKKFLFLGSVCIYPKYAPVPVKESSLLDGELEPTNYPYAIAKISGIKMLQAYYKQYGFKSVSLMPCNLYGPGDNFHPYNSHVIPGMIRKFHSQEDEVILWGDGTPQREFMYSEDLADACLFAMNRYEKSELLNVGTGENVSIKDLSNIISQTTEFRGNIVWDTSRPNGTPNRPLDSSIIYNDGWRPKTNLSDGLTKTYKWFKDNFKNIADTHEEK